MLDLKNVTLLFVETRAHEITKRVIPDCLSKADFGDVLVFTDDQDRIGIPGVRYIKVPDFPNKKEAGRFYYANAMHAVSTDFALMLEWDAGIYDPSKWKPEFFEYDYVGAPWVGREVRDGHDVGNGGFTLMSKRLGHFLATHRVDFPCVTDWDICRKYRSALERHGGFRWPSHALAEHFSWELGPRNPEHFGYHATFTWPEVLSQPEIAERAKIMVKSPYLLTKLFDLVKAAPWLQQELSPLDWQAYQNANAHRIRRGHQFTPAQRAAMIRTIATRAPFVNQMQKGLKA